MELVSDAEFVSVVMVLVVTLSWLGSWLGQRDNSFGDTLGHKMFSLVLALLITVGYNLVALGQNLEDVRHGFDQTNAVLMLVVMGVSTISSMVLNILSNEKLKFGVYLGLVGLSVYLAEKWLVPYLLNARLQLPAVLLFYQEMI